MAKTITRGYLSTLSEQDLWILMDDIKAILNQGEEE
jgi:hypothetical protein